MMRYEGGNSGRKYAIDRLDRFLWPDKTGVAVEGTLADKLFQPPDSYQRVASLPNSAYRPVPRTWAELLWAHWQMIEDWFSTPF